MTEDYLDQVGRAFLSHTGRGLMLSPRDRGIVERWCRAGIPAEIVIVGLNRAFENKPKRVHSIAFASQWVEKAAQAWRNRSVGGHVDEVHIDHDLERAFGILSERLNEFFNSSIKSELVVIAEFGKSRVLDIQSYWRRNNSFDYAEALEELETQVCEKAYAALNETERDAINREVDEALLSMNFASSKAKQASRLLFRNRRVRNRLGLPSFQLSHSRGW